MTRQTKDQGPATKNSQSTDFRSSSCALRGARGPALRRLGEGGFALLIVITLLAFVVVLLVGLAAYTRIETSVAGNTQRQAQARENALFALNIAVGQLQKYAGPDQRVTATAEAVENATGTSRYTGVWHSDPTINETPATPLTWLVSGNETIDPDGVDQPLTTTPATPGSAVVDLVGLNTTGSRTRNANYVIAPLQNIRTAGVPGTRPGVNTTIGRYAWWVGDQGVKAPVAVADSTSTISYSPYNSDDLRARLRQQMSLGAGAADSGGNPVFEPLDANNSPLVANNKVTALSQIAFLRRTNTTQVGTLLRTYFHTWSPNNFAVLANTKIGGLRQDLSLNPSLLGSAFAAWANYPAYMEPAAPPAPPDPDNPAPAGPLQISPAYGNDPLRRRYRITAPVAADGAVHGVAPVLCECLLNFNLQTTTPDAGEQPLQARVRAIVGLWNPYTSALVPPQSPAEDLRIEVTGLPEIADFVDDNGVTLASVRLRDAFGQAFTLQLPWTADNPSLPNLAENKDFSSWLPGRVYYWTSVANTGEPNTSMFYHKTFVGMTGLGFMARPNPNGSVVDSAAKGQWIVRTPTNLTIQLFRGSDPTPLGTYSSPPFPEFLQNDSVTASADSAQFGFFFRLDQNKTDPQLETWLTSAGRDPRSVTLPDGAFIGGADGLNPALYGGTPSITNDDLLLERTMGTTGEDYKYEVPVFELPRSPILSEGMLQHLQLPGQRPFAIGNPWGTEAQLNNIRTGELFDRFFFSGVTADIAPTPTATGDLILPNSLLQPLRKSDGTKPTVNDFHATEDAAANTYSSRFLLTGGAFNLNSTNSTAWAAVLRGVRFPDPKSFVYLDVSSKDGTAADTAHAPPVQSPDAQFFRFSQSAQETYKPADVPSPANTDLFRRGMKTLRSDQVDALATNIANLVKTKQAASGPFRSLEEFLAPSATFGVPGAPAGEAEEPPPPGPPRSLLEAAIADANINVDGSGNPLEFSSQYLTQADIMTALAPVLFPRSDTFVIRTYGEAINPTKLATNGSVPAEAVEGRAWCEAIVQRVPEYLDPDRSVANPDDPDAPLTFGDAAEIPPANLTSDLNKSLGRRFKVISFRWLSRSDI